jgi:hypothetical protein
VRARDRAIKDITTLQAQILSLVPIGRIKPRRGSSFWSAGSA